MLSGGGTWSRVVRDKRELHVGRRMWEGGPGLCGAWRWGCRDTRLEAEEGFL